MPTNAVRVKRADGTWQDIALMGPPGPVGAASTVPGPQGPKGDAGGTMGAAVFRTLGAGYTRSMAPSGSWSDLSPSTGGTVVIEPVGAFIDNSASDRSIVITDAGWYDIEAIVSTVEVAYDNTIHVSLSTTRNGAELAISSGRGSSSMAAKAQVATTAKFTAGQKFWINGQVGASCSLQVTHMSVCRVGGPKGDPGAPGAPGGTMDAVNYRSSNIGTAGPTASVTNGAYVVMDPRVSGQALIEPAGSFIENADKTVTVVNAGWYSISGSVVTLVNYDGAITTKIDVDGVTVANMGARGEVGRGAQANVSTAAVKLVAGAKVSIQAIAGAPSGTVNCALQQFSITRVGGPKGDKGADGAAGGNATVPIDPWHTVGAAGEPTFTGWGGSTVKFRKDPLGRVYIWGACSTGPANTSMFTLPVGYRPTQDRYFDTLRSAGAAGGYVVVYANGQVLSYTVDNYIDLDFDTETVTAMPTGPQGPPGPGVRGLVAALPVNPQDGDECYYQDATLAAQGIIWHLRYRSASTSPYKWEVLGAPPPLWDEVVGVSALTTANGYSPSLADFADVGLTMPLAGIYDCEGTCEAYNDQVSTHNRFGISINTATGTSADCVASAPSGANQVEIITRHRRLTATAAGQIIRKVYAIDAGTGYFRNRSLRVRPVRVG